ncbi:MAG: hypothetical protein ACLVGW_01410 [Evtepia gabavorous]
MKAVFRHELSSYFTGMTGYVFGAFLLLFAGIYTMAVNLNAGLSNFEYVLSNLSFIFLIIVPISPCGSLPRSAGSGQTSCSTPSRCP